MSDVTIYGAPLSTYVRTIRMQLEEKGIAYDLDPLMPNSEKLKPHHPFGRIPAFQHGDVRLFESCAVAGYIERVLDGRSLQPPRDPALALMHQWISVVDSYCYPVMIRGICLPRLGLRPLDEDAVKDAAAKCAWQLEVLSEALGERDYLIGEELTLADLFLFPVVFYLKGTPEGTQLLGDDHPVARWHDRLAARASARATVPQAPASAERSLRSERG